ncbi:MAG: hypothetical protein NTW96_19665 [Planctomycetia bacterium]|nr:hypothetical protein [Planctomycetia bacterium]
MKPLLPLAVLLAVGIAGCSKTEPKTDPYAKYREAQLTRGIKIADIKQQFGEPDSYRDWWSEKPHNPSRYSGSSEPSPECPYHVEELGHGAFGAHDQARGHITKHRLSMTFVDGELYTWEKSTPIDRE